jgi:hypothetical protein
MAYFYQNQFTKVLIFGVIILNIGKGVFSGKPKL